jgi:hypothetical protein
LVRSPLLGLAELIWNSLDADADNVEVTYERSVMGGIQAVRVADDGHGMSPTDIEDGFGHLGGSWKRLAEHSKTKGRSLHGRSGQGRWRALGIGGDRAVWETVADVDGQRLLSHIEINRADLRDADVSEPVETDRPIGTVASVEGISEAPAGLLADETPLALATRFALHLAKYPSARIKVDGRTIDPSQAWESVTELQVEAGEKHGPAALTVILWKREVERKLYLCDSEGVALHELAAGVQAPGLHFTAYLKSPLIRELEGQLLLADLDQEHLSPLIEAGRRELKRDQELAGRRGLSLCRASC